MKVFVAGLLVIWAVLDVTSAGMRIRRSLGQPTSGSESESNSPPPREVLVIKSTPYGFSTGPRHDFIPKDNDSQVLEVDIQDDGKVQFEGHLPCDFHSTDPFAIMAELHRYFEAMTRNVIPGLDSFGPSVFRPPIDVGSVPDNTNKTDTEIVTIDGKQYSKTTTTIKKGGGESSIFIQSVHYEPVDDTENKKTGPEIEGSPSSEEPNPDGKPIQQPQEPHDAQDRTKVTDSPSSSSVSTPNEREREKMTSGPFSSF